MQNALKDFHSCSSLLFREGKTPNDIELKNPEKNDSTMKGIQRLTIYRGVNPQYQADVAR